MAKKKHTSKRTAQSAPSRKVANFTTMEVNRIAKIKTSDLPIKHTKKEPPEHYVYVREYDKKKRVYKVNICTHLDKYDAKKGKYVNNDKHIQQVKYGNTYPVPLSGANFPCWTGIKKDIYEVPVGKMYAWNCVKVKEPHKKSYYDNFFK